MKGTKVQFILAMIVTLSGSSVQAEGASLSNQALADRFAVLEGHYKLGSDGKRIVFDGKPQLAQLLSTYPQSELVGQLIACMDDERPSKVTNKGSVVVVGMLCYEALTITVYYEPVDKRGDIAKSWPGYLKSGDLSIKSLKAAKRAWEEVAKRKAYIFL